MSEWIEGYAAALAMQEKMIRLRFCGALSIFLASIFLMWVVARFGSFDNFGRYAYGQRIFLKEAELSRNDQGWIYKVEIRNCDSKTASLVSTHQSCSCITRQPSSDELEACAVSELSFEVSELDPGNYEFEVDFYVETSKGLETVRTSFEVTSIGKSSDSTVVDELAPVPVTMTKGE